MTRLRPERLVPLAVHLAVQGASGMTGQVLRAMEWNQQHAAGGVEDWAYPADLVHA